MCERVRVWVCAVASKRGRALNGEMGEVRGRLCASAQVIDAMGVKSRVFQAPTRGRMVTGCCCGSETGTLCCLGANLVGGSAQSKECLNKGFLP